MARQRLGLERQVEAHLAAKAGGRVAPGVVGAHQDFEFFIHGDHARRLGHQVRSRSCHDAHHRRVRQLAELQRAEVVGKELELKCALHKRLRLAAGTSPGAVAEHEPDMLARL